jgi:hypothetical protein
MEGTAMLTRIAITVLCLVIVTGCSKKSSTPAAKTDNPAPPNPQAAAKAKLPEEKLKDGKANWLTDPRAEVEKNQLPVENSGGRDLGIKLPVPEVVPPPRGAPGAVGEGAKGVLQAQPNAPAVPSAPPKVGKLVTEADMKEVWIFIENASGASGKMPSPALVYSALVKAESKAADLVKDGSIFLTGAAARESIWAFEWKALTQGGLAASQNGVENLSAAELKRRLGK